MDYKLLGKTKLKVSQISLGTWGIGGAGWDNYPDAERLDAIAAAVESGINLIDTAPAYNSGKAEQYIGSALEDLGAREKVYISTKCGSDFKDGKYYRCGGYDNVMHQCERSLKNLRTGYIDILLIHWPDPNASLADTCHALRNLKEQGIVHHLGVSNLSDDEIKEASAIMDIEVFQPQYSMLRQGDAERIQLQHENGVGIMGYGTLGGGILTGRYRKAENYSPIDSRNRFYPYFKEPLFSKTMKLLEPMQEIADRHQASLAEVAINWTRQKSFMDTCLIGAQSRKRIEENTRCFKWKLTEAEMSCLDNTIDDLAF